jgi:hypothetical protein
MAAIHDLRRGPSIRFRRADRMGLAPWIALVGGVGVLGVAGCGGGGSGGGGSLKLGAVASLTRAGDSTHSLKTYKYKTAVISVRRGDLKGETVLGDAPKNDVAFFVTQRVTGVQAGYSGWAAEPPDVYDSSGKQATPLETGTDLRHCVDRKTPAGFGPGKSFETCDVYLLPPGKQVAKVVLAGEGPGQNDLTWKLG